jgi:signal transduction histidine kinase
LILYCFKNLFLNKIADKDKYIQSLEESLEAITDLYSQVNLKRELLAADLRIKLEMLQETYGESVDNIVTFISPNQTSAKLIDEYLSHVEAGRYALYIKEISVKAILEFALKVLSKVSLEKKITINSNIDDTLHFEFDETLLIQVLATILNSSIGPLQKNGRIDIHITVIEKEGIKGLSLKLKDNSYGVKLDRELMPVHLQSVLLTNYRLESMIKHCNGTIDTKLELGEGREVDLFLPLLSDEDQEIITQAFKDNVIRIF